MAQVQRRIVHKQFNSPIALYSDTNIKATLDRELKSLGNGAVGWVLFLSSSSSCIFLYFISSPYQFTFHWVFTHTHTFHSHSVHIISIPLILFSAIHPITLFSRTLHSTFHSLSLDISLQTFFYWTLIEKFHRIFCERSVCVYKCEYVSLYMMKVAKEKSFKFLLFILFFGENHTNEIILHKLTQTIFFRKKIIWMEAMVMNDRRIKWSHKKI